MTCRVARCVCKYKYVGTHTLRRWKSRTLSNASAVSLAVKKANCSTGGSGRRGAGGRGGGRGGGEGGGGAGGGWERGGTRRRRKRGQRKKQEVSLMCVADKIESQMKEDYRDCHRSRIPPHVSLYLSSYTSSNASSNANERRLQRLP